MGLAAFVLGGIVLACALVRALFSVRVRDAGDESDVARLLDGASALAVVAIGVWVATSWLLALAGRLSAVSLIAAAVVEFAVGGVWLYRTGAPTTKEYPAPSPASACAIALALSAPVLWTAFVAWRGTLLPVYNHDALAYHLPKAVLLAKAGAFHVFDVPEARIATWPCNYELLLADTLVLTGGDTWTAAIGTFSYVAFVLMAARVAAAWWGSGPHVAFTAAVAATAPIAVLHSGLHKNNLLIAVFALGAFSWAARWCARGCRASAVLACLALVLAAGTNASAAFTVVATLPVLAIGAWRHRRAVPPRAIGTFVAVAAFASLLLGGAAYLANFVAFSRPIRSVPGQGGYGDWSSIWQFTAMLILAPFSRRPGAVWNPFRGQYWWWQANDVWMSNLGAAFSIGSLALGPCVWRYRRWGRASCASERSVASLAALAAYILTLPIRWRPLGFFSTDVRYVFCVLPIVLGWTLCPVLVDLRERLPRARGALAIATGALIGAYVARSIYRFGVEDAYAPFEWVVYVFHHPEDRRPFVRRDRAASVFDAIAGPSDACAIDVGFDTWIYPAYGRGLTRKVEFLKPAAGEVAIPDDVQWVLVDRSWNVFFGHPKFVDMGKAQYLGRGTPSDDDLKVYRQLRADPRFEIVYDNRRYNQAVFHRRAKAGGGDAPK